MNRRPPTTRPARPERIWPAGPESLSCPPRIRRREHGSALVISLMLLILVTMFGFASIRAVGLEEKMAGNSIDRNLALQAAEAVLREGEQVALDQSNAAPPNNRFPTYSDSDPEKCSGTSAINASCSSGLCAAPDINCVPRWDPDSGFTGWTNYTGDSLGALAGAAPQYFVEYLGDTYPCTDGGPSDPKNCKRYRVTARSNPGAGRASVMLQSIYATD